MVARMEVSFHKYGAAAQAPIDCVQSALMRLAKYLGTRKLKEYVADLPVMGATRNTEYLIDASNFCMMEFMRRGPAACRPTDASGSPGRAIVSEWKDDPVEYSQRANDLTPQG